MTIEFTKSFLKDMEILKKTGKFYDLDLKEKVYQRMFDLEEKANDDQLHLFSVMEEAGDDEEYWNCIHVLASYLDII